MGAKWNKFVESFIVNEGYKLVLEGLSATLRIALIGFVIGLILGIIIATIKVSSRKNKIVKALSVVADVYVGFFRGTPILVQLLLGHFVLFPLIGLNLPAIMEATLVFGLNSTAYVSEIIRSGILSVDVGQMEAGRSLGLSYSKTMIKIVFPQAIKNSLPSLGNEIIALIKDTSVASMVAVMDLTNAFQLVAGGKEYIIPYCVLALCYLVLVLILTLIIKLIERRMRASDKR
jgi:polar amino acid transport system permease protein